jgi:hypothetical protein
MKRTYKSKNYKQGYKDAMKDFEISLANVSTHWMYIPKGASLQTDITIARNDHMSVMIQANLNHRAVYLRKIGDTLIITPSDNIL